MSSAVYSRREHGRERGRVRGVRAGVARARAWASGWRKPVALSKPAWLEVQERPDACLDVARAFGYVDAVDAKLLDALDHIRATLFSVVR